MSALDSCCTVLSVCGLSVLLKTVLPNNGMHEIRKKTCISELVDIFHIVQWKIFCSNMVQTMMCRNLGYTGLKARSGKVSEPCRKWLSKNFCKKYWTSDCQIKLPCLCRRAYQIFHLPPKLRIGCWLMRFLLWWLKSHIPVFSLLFMPYLCLEIHISHTICMLELFIKFLLFSITSSSSSFYSHL